jgi:hypothetical protein
MAGLVLPLSQHEYKPCSQYQHQPQAMTEQTGGELCPAIPGRRPGLHFDLVSKLG